jgi:hypothetical protein
MSEVLPHLAAQIEETAIEGLIKGYAQVELVNILTKDFPEVPQEEVEKVIRGALKRIRESTMTDLDKIIPQHIEIYEKVYAEFDELYYVPGKLKALKQKEKIVGLHKESNTIEIHNEVNIEVEKESGYDISKLTKEEQGRLGELMKRVLNK